jgi:hypothetical protein
MTTRWLNYLPALEHAIAVMSDELESLDFRGAWSPDHKTQGLHALQVIRRAWTQSAVSEEAFAVLERLGDHEALSSNVCFRGALESIEHWSQELLEEQRDSPGTLH